MRDRRVRLVLLSLTLAFPFVVELRNPPVGRPDRATIEPSRSAEAATSPAAQPSTSTWKEVGRLGVSELVLVVGVFYAGRQRRRLLTARTAASVDLRTESTSAIPEPVIFPSAATVAAV